MRVRIALITFFAAAMASTAFADGQVTTPALLQLSPQAVPPFLKGVGALQPLSGTVQTNLPDITLTSPYSVTLSGIHLQVTYALSSPQETASPLSWALGSTALSATLIVDNIVASETLQASSGGSTIDVTVQASCAGTRLDLPQGAVQASGEVTLGLSNGAVTLQLSQFTANWAPGAWTVTSLNCTGAQGFGDLVAQAAESQLQTIDPFVSTIQTDVQGALDRAAGRLQSSWTLQAPSGISIALSPLTLTQTSSGALLLGGTALAVFPAATSSCTADLSTGTAPSEPSDPGSSALVFPDVAIPALIACAYDQGALVAQWTSAQFPAFASLLHSFFLKLFIWPDLLDFGKNAQFAFAWQPSAMPAVSIAGTSSTGLPVLSVATTSPIVVSAPSRLGMLPYTDFTLPLTGTATLAISDGTLSVQSKISKLKLSYRWDPAYFVIEHPGGSIWTSIIASYLKSYLDGNPLLFALPSFQMADGTQATLSALTHTSDSMVVGLDFTAQTAE